MSNVFSFTGTLGRDAERKHISGFTLLEFAVANNIGYGDKQKTLWVRCQVWGKRAEGALGDYLTKGTKVFVSGELDLNEYQGKDGTNKSTLTLNANIVELCSKKEAATQDQAAPTTPSSAPVARQQQSPPTKQPAQSNAAYSAEYDDEIPF